jgi:hypothetical protein
MIIKAKVQIMAYFKMLSQQLPKRAEENHENRVITLMYILQYISAALNKRSCLKDSIKFMLAMVKGLYENIKILVFMTALTLCPLRMCIILGNLHQT